MDLLDGIIPAAKGKGMKAIEKLLKENRFSKIQNDFGKFTRFMYCWLSMVFINIISIYRNPIFGCNRAFAIGYAVYKEQICQC